MLTHVSLAYAGEVLIILPVSWHIIACFVLPVRLKNQSILELSCAVGGMR